MKRIIGFIVCFVVVFGVFASFSVSASETKADGSLGENLKWQYDGNGTLTICGKGKMKKPSSGSYPWEKIENDIKVIVVEEGCTVLSSNSFWMCSELIAVFLPKTLEEVESNTFECCSRLKYIYYAGSKSEWEEVKQGMDNYYMSSPSVIYDQKKFVSEEIRIFKIGNEIKTEQPPVVVNNRTLAPADAIFESMEYSVLWDENTQTVTASKKVMDSGREKEKTIVLQIGSNEMLVDGEVTSLDISVQIVNGQVMVPVRAIAEANDYAVHWIPSVNWVNIAYKR